MRMLQAQQRHRRAPPVRPSHPRELELLRDKYETKVDRLESKIDKLEARAERDLEKIDSLQFRLDAERERVMELSSLAQDYSKVGKRNIEEQEKLEVLTRTV